MNALQQDKQMESVKKAAIINKSYQKNLSQLDYELLEEHRNNYYDLRQSINKK
jgi:hypothetical protein